MNPYIERRRYPRLAKNLPIKIRTTEFDLVTQTKNISGNGASCQVDRYIAAMSKLEVVVLLSQTPKKVVKIQCEGVVARIEQIEDNKELSKPIYNIAIFFNKISNSDLNKINKYVKKHLSKTE